MYGKKSTRWHWISLPLKYTEQTIYKERNLEMNPSKDFFNFWRWTSEGKSIDTAGKSVLKLVILPSLSWEILQMFLWWGEQTWPPPYKLLCNFGELYLSSLKTYYFHIWQFYKCYDTVSGVDRFSLTGPCQSSMSNEMLFRVLVSKFGMGYLKFLKKDRKKLLKDH